MLEASRTAHKWSRLKFLLICAEARALLDVPFFLLLLGSLSCKNKRGEEIPSNDLSMRWGMSMFAFLIVLKLERRILSVLPTSSSHLWPKIFFPYPTPASFHGSTCIGPASLKGLVFPQISKAVFPAILDLLKMRGIGKRDRSTCVQLAFSRYCR